MSADAATLFREVEALVAALERVPDAPARERARDLVRAVLDLHAAGLARLLEVASAQGDAGRAVIDRCAGDPLVAAVLLLHGLHPVDLATRVQSALASLESALRTRGATAVLVSADDGVVRVRLDRAAGEGVRAAPADVLRGLVFEALDAAAPDAATLDVVAPDEPVAGFVPASRLRAGDRGAP